MAKQGIVLGTLGFVVLAVSLALSVPHRSFGALPKQAQDTSGVPNNGQPNNGRPGNGQPGNGLPDNGLPVFVINPSSRPIPVELAKSHCTCGTPFSIRIHWSAGFPNNYSVPAGKLLVLEHLSFLINRTGTGTDTGTGAILQVSPGVGESPVDYFFSGILQDTDPVERINTYVGTHPIKIYARAGAQVMLGPLSTTLGGPALYGSLSGRLEDAP
jgi:hypothetical protein